MCRITFFKLLVMNLEGEIQEGRREHMPPDESYKLLKESTGQDFGGDIFAWKAWLKANKKHYPNIYCAK